jgi:two-component system OmpR family response regulator
MSKNNNVKIFIVEDNKMFSLALKADIEMAFGHRASLVETFETGEAMMAVFNTNIPDIVILDYNLDSKNPDAANGIKILNWIKNENPETEVVMLTSEDSLDIAVKSLTHGASDYVVKSETKFKKINYALLNLIKMKEADSDAKRYKSIATGLAISMAVLIGAVIIIQICLPSFLK